ELVGTNSERFRVVDSDAADGIDREDHTVEVDNTVVVDFDAEVLLDSGNGALNTVLGHHLVQAGGSHALELDAGIRQEIDRAAGLLIRIEMDNDHHVRVAALDMVRFG